MLGALIERDDDPTSEQLLKLYWNRAGVKRELRALRQERFELLDKLKEQEGAIVRAQEQLEGLERLLTNPLAAANAMVYFQLRHLWRVGAQRLEQFRSEQLLKLYWNRAGVKRELRALRQERFELLDKLKEQEGAIVRAQEQLEGLERLLTNPLAAANAMVYFQLRHLWRVGAQRLEQF